MNIVELNNTGSSKGIIIKNVIEGAAPIMNQNKEVVITENGTITIKADRGFTGLGSVKIIVATPINVNNYLTIEALEDGLTVERFGNDYRVEYCIDGNGMWQTLAINDATPPINTGQTISFKCNLSQGQQFGSFNISKKYNVYGNIMSLLYGDKSISNNSLEGYESVFSNLFSISNYAFGVNINLIDASNLILPATTLESSCYEYMFRDCTSLVNAPKLPATTLKYGCYESMFSGCTSLVNAPELPATSVPWNCYQGMFRYCTSLVNAPELLATTLGSSCYNYMFYGCSKLQYIKAMFTSTPSNLYTKGWLSGVSPLGIFVKNSAATWDVTGDDGIPEGWTVEYADA